LSAEHVVTVLLIGGKKAVLVEEADISKAIFAGLGVVLDVRGIVGVEFAVEAGTRLRPRLAP